MTYLAATQRQDPDPLKSSCGFTLLEFLVVLAILGLVAGVAVIQLKGSCDVARLGDAASRLVFLDCQARTHLQRFAHDARLVFDLDANTAYVVSDDAEYPETFRLMLPSGIRLDRIRSEDRQAESGQISIDLSPGGQSSSYAVRLSAGGRYFRWLFFAGLTGQAVEFTDKDEDDVSRLFEILRPFGADVD